MDSLKKRKQCIRAFYPINHTHICTWFEICYIASKCHSACVSGIYYLIPQFNTNEEEHLFCFSILTFLFVYRFIIMPSCNKLSHTRMNGNEWKTYTNKQIAHDHEKLYVHLWMDAFLNLFRKCASSSCTKMTMTCVYILSFSICIFMWKGCID